MKGLRLEECESTNLEARKLAAEGAPSGSWVSARRQTGGRGRQGRSWVGVEGNLFLSVLVRPRRSDRLTWIGLAVGLALARWVRETTGVEARVKWPNDLLVGGRKLAGILCESIGGAQGVAVIVGVGLNCAATPEVSDRAVTSLAAERGDAGLDASAIDEEVAVVIAAAIEELEEDDGIARLREHWEPYSALPRGSRIEWDGGVGQVLGLGFYGELRVSTPEGERALLAEEVHLKLG